MRVFLGVAIPRRIGEPDSAWDALPLFLLDFLWDSGFLSRFVVLTDTESGVKGFRMTFRGMDSHDDSSNVVDSADVVVAQEVSSEVEGMRGRRRFDDVKRDFVRFILRVCGIRDVYSESSFFGVLVFGVPEN